MRSSILSGLGVTGDERQAKILQESKTTPILAIDDETSLIQDIARDAFMEIKKNLLESNIQPTLWSVLIFLLERTKDSAFRILGQVEYRGHFSFVIEDTSGNEYNSLFIKELLSWIFQEMAAVQVDITILPDNAVNLRIPRLC